MVKGKENMDWLKVTVCTASDAIDLVCDSLRDIGIDGFEIEDEAEFEDFLENNKKYWDYVDEELAESKRGETKVIFYIPNTPDAADVIKSAEQKMLELKSKAADIDLGKLQISCVGLNEEDWANNWKKYFKPTKIGDKILICPQWCECDNDDGRIVFTVNPGMTFGTGTHASTRMCIAELEKIVTPETTLLDAGCGSGILSIISLMLGAKSASAVDIDENCIHVAYENAEMNGIDKSRYNVYSGDITNDKPLFDKLQRGGGYDIIVANIVADVIISLLPTVKKLIAKGGTFVCSGIIAERLEDVKNAMNKENIQILRICEESGWAAIVCKF